MPPEPSVPCFSLLQLCIDLFLGLRDVSHHRAPHANQRSIAIQFCPMAEYVPLEPHGSATPTCLGSSLDAPSQFFMAFVLNSERRTNRAPVYMPIANQGIDYIM